MDEQNIDIETLSQNDYIDKKLKAEGLEYISKAKFIADYQRDIMEKYIGTKAQCDIKYEETKKEAEILYKERGKGIAERTNELRSEWFDFHTSDMTEIEKEFVTRVAYHFDKNMSDAIDMVSEFSDLLKNKKD